MRALKSCCNGDGNTIHAPSKVLCKKCFEELNRKMLALPKEVAERQARYGVEAKP